MINPSPLWSPSSAQIAESGMRKFADWVEGRTNKSFGDYEALHTWSCEPGGEFWDAVWDYCGIVGDKGNRIVADEEKLPGAEYFPDAKLNYAENLLKFTGGGDALVFRCEDKIDRRVSWDELHALVSRLQQAFSKLGVGVGDRVAAMMPNMPETVAAMLATNSLGAIWSSCSPDFGEQGVMDRFGQIEPKLFITSDGYWYNGKRNFN